ncbi:MAG: hypothetical protein IJW54_00870 [Clostridia bacterium]|nr:hypothetical protein [Clostridia bacterium]
MREKIYNVLNKIYGVMIISSLFAGFLPVFPFIYAIIAGGETGANISVFLYKQYYPWVTVAAAVAVLIGLIALYINKTITFKYPKKEKKSKDEVVTDDPCDNKVESREKESEMPSCEDKKD